MLHKTAISHVDGSVCGKSGPATVAIPQNEGFYVDEAEQYGWRIFRVSPIFVVLEDCGQIMVKKAMERTPTKERRGLASLFTKFISWTHGVLLRRLGRRRVVWMMRVDGKGGKNTHWRGNVNVVTGLKEAWLMDRSNFQSISNGRNSQLSEETIG